MIDALYSGISGLNSYQSALNTESNNIANVNTVAYKSDNISFADLMYQSDIGKGSKIDTIDKNYSQGNIKITNNSLDMAIEGKGYFITKGDTAELTFTRAGNFRMSADGTLRLPNDNQVLGVPATVISSLSTDDTNRFTFEYTKFLGSETLISDDSQVIETINTKATNYEISAKTDDLAQSGNNYKSRESKINDVKALSKAYSEELKIFSASVKKDTELATTQNTKVAFDKRQIINSLNSMEIVIEGNLYRQAFDTDAQTTLNKLADKISDIDMLKASVDANGVMNIESLLPGKEVNISDAKIIDGAVTATPLPILTTVAANIGSGKERLESIELALKNAIEIAGAKFLKISNVVNSNEISSNNIGNLQLKLDTLEISDNPFGEAEIENGIIYLKQGDNRFVIGKVVTAVFTNDFGLNPNGDNLYSKTAESGEFIFGTTENKILAKKLELSNSDLSQSLVNLMVFQRSFEASSKSITTSDEFLKTAINLKK